MGGIKSLYEETVFSFLLINALVPRKDRYLFETKEEIVLL